MTFCVVAVALIASCGGLGPSPSIEPRVATPPAPSPSAEPAPTAAPLDERFDALLREAQDDTGAGIAISIIHPTITWNGSLGDADAGRPMTSDTSFAIGSVTKTFMAALVLRLDEAGRVDLDAPLAGYLPRDIGIDLNRATVREALGHRSGIGEHTSTAAFFEDVLAEPARTWEPREALAYAVAPQFDAGADWGYSNSNYVVLALLVEEVTGLRVAAAMEDELLGPAGLDKIVFQPDAAPAGPLAVGQSDFDGDGRVEPIAGGGLLPTRALATAAGGAGGMASDAPSLARWGELLYGGDILSDESMAAMTDFRPSGSVGYGLGTIRLVYTEGHVGVGHNGSIPGFSSALVHLPDAGVTVAVLINADLVRPRRDPLDVARPFVLAAVAEPG